MEIDKHLSEIPNSYWYQPWQLGADGAPYDFGRDKTESPQCQILSWASMQPLVQEIYIYIDRDGNFGVARITESGRFEGIALVEDELVLADLLWKQHDEARLEHLRRLSLNPDR